MRTKRIAIIHPWMPQYRLGLFDLLENALSDEHVELDVYFGEPESDWALRGDNLESHPKWSGVPTSKVKIGSKTLFYKHLGNPAKFRKYDLVIVEHALRNLETYSLFLVGVRVAFWGHGRTYTQPSSGIQEYLKLRLAKLGRWFFTYTRGGSDYITAHGYPLDRVTVLNNSFDSRNLEKQLAQITKRQADDFIRNELGEGTRIGLFLGALDKVKKISFLIDACSLVASLDPGFRLVVIGDGPLRSLVESEAWRRKWIIYKGPQFGEYKTLSLSCAHLLLVPGRLGLAAIDSFVSSVPIITTTDPFHPPEFEYLEDRINSRIVREVSSEYADAILDSLRPEIQEVLREGCRQSKETYTIASMVQRFRDGIISALEESSE